MDSDLPEGLQAMPDTFMYFAYGSNMFTRRLRERAPSAKPQGTGFLSNFLLAFDKISTDGSGKCNIRSTNSGDDRVYGVLYELALADAAALDLAEGLGSGYRKAEVPVTTAAGERLLATTYVADHTDSQLQPYSWYKEFVVRGAMEHGLPAFYVRCIQLIDSWPDSNALRSRRNEALLARE